MPILGRNQSLFGSNGQFKAPRPILQVLNWREHVLQYIGAGKWVFQGRPPTKKKVTFPKNGLKLPILGRKQCFLGSGGHFKDRQPFFALTQNHMFCRVWKPGNGFFRATPPPKMHIFCPKWLLFCTTMA